MVVYVTSQGARIEKEGRRLIIHGKDFKQTLFSSRLEQLVLFGNVSITAPAMHVLFGKDIDTVFLRRDGSYVGRFAMQEPANATLRKRQFALCDDLNFRLKVGRSIVLAKILNQATVLARIKRARNKPQALVAANNIRELARGLERTTTCDALRGIEGKAAAIYFPHLQLGFTKDWGFRKRVRRPPTDPVNCVLSFLYTLLTNRCYAAIRRAGLDPQPGILHDLSYGRASLPLDLVEEFRALLADTLTLSLFNMSMLHKDDFESPKPVQPEPVLTEEDRKNENLKKVLSDPLGAISESGSAQPVAEEDCGDPEGENELPQEPSKAILLTKNAIKTVISAFSQKMETAFHHPHAGREMTYGEAIVYQARQLRRVIDGSAESYVPLTLR